MIFACDAIDDAAIDRIIENITPSIKKTSMDVNYVNFEYLPSICKSWPQRPGLDIIVVPYAYGKKYLKADGNQSLGIAVAVVDRKRKKETMQLDERRVASIGKIYPYEVTIDTADYKAGNENFLFGVRVSLKRNDRPRSFSFYDKFMTLYDISQGTIRPVVNKLMMYNLSGVEDGMDMCPFSSSELTTLISVGKQETNGFADLIVQAKRNLSSFKKTNSVCRQTDTRSSTKEYTMKFNGKDYDIPMELSDGASL